jgi:hypothetical protein
MLRSRRQINQPRKKACASLRFGWWMHYMFFVFLVVTVLVHIAAWLDFNFDEKQWRERHARGKALDLAPGGPPSLAAGAASADS